MSKRDAARYGVGEIAVPIISSTATTLAAFAPLLFWDSIMGEFMKFLPITLIVVLGSSLFVGLVINPVFASLFMKKEEHKGVNWKSLIMTVGIEVAFSVAFYLADMFSLGTIFATLAILTVINAFVLRPVSAWFQHRFWYRWKVLI
jgi:multidrug efflux pump subunit AcrB